MAKTYEISPDVLNAQLRELLMSYALQSGERVDELSLAAVKQLAQLTKDTAPVDTRPKKKTDGNQRPHFFTSISHKKLEAGWFGASRYLWFVKKPNYRLTHLIAKSRRAKNNRTVPGNPFLQSSLDTVLHDYEEAIRRYFVE